MICGPTGTSLQRLQLISAPGKKTGQSPIPDISSETALVETQRELTCDNVLGVKHIDCVCCSFVVIEFGRSDF